MALVAASTLREYLPEITGTDADTELNNLIARVESAIARYLGFPLADSATSPSLDQAAYTAYLDGPFYTDSSILQLPIKPLVSVTSLHSDSNLEYGSSTEIASSQFQLDKQNSRIILNYDSTASFDVGFRNIKVVFQAGYDNSSPPADLVHAICLLAAKTQRSKVAQGYNALTARNVSITLSPKSLSLEVKELLAGFRNATVIL
jgi:hypothetical protein